MRKQDDHEKQLTHSDTNNKEPYLFIPTEAEIDTLIANSGNKTSTFSRAQNYVADNSVKYIGGALKQFMG